MLRLIAKLESNHAAQGGYNSGPGMERREDESEDESWEREQRVGLKKGNESKCFGQGLI